ncbi:hypothetical protein, partial [Vibrio breoganii]|uniref:hypothetical protein n=1 Tax=Vibrio breoganii TaxID=553239 RepID=UPI001A7E0A4E
FWVLGSGEILQTLDMKKLAIKAGYSKLKPGDVLLPHGRCGDPQTHATFPRFRYEKTRYRSGFFQI